MSNTSTHLSLPYLAPAQAQKHVTHNEGLRMLDVLVQLSLRVSGVKIRGLLQPMLMARGIIFTRKRAGSVSLRIRICPSYLTA